MSFRTFVSVFALVAIASGLFVPPCGARNAIRNEFFARYPGASSTRLWGLPSNSKHCGVCHFDFSGGGPRNPYGLGIQVGLNNGLSTAAAIAAIELEDSDGDAFDNLVEITDAGFSNTPTFPGLTAGNVGSILNIPSGEVTPYLTPAGATDVTPPVVSLLAPNGGGSFPAGQYTTVTWTASDVGSGVDRIELYFSDDGGVEFEVAAKNLPNTGSFAWFVPNLPGTATRIRVEAYDVAGNSAHDDSDADFTVLAQSGIAPTTLRDMKLPGTQPFEGAILDDPSTNCVTCHGNYDSAVEPWYNWQGSMMAHAARDPLFFACVAVAEQDAPSVGDLCLRCHTPGGWQEGRSTDTSGGMLTAKDRQGIHCDFCHRGVDPEYVPGVSPAQDVAVLAGIDPLPSNHGNGQFISDPAPLRRGPYADAQASHDFVESPFHRSSAICGTCHDVSSPVYVRVTGTDYTLDVLDQEHPDFDIRNMLPIERTYSEWQNSEYATTGVYAPQFAGVKPDGIVSTCQDCHMRDVSGRGSNQNSPIRADLGLHDMTGGNTFIPDILPSFFPGEVNVAQLQAGKARATAMLEMAATLEVLPTSSGVDVKIINETGHKLPSGYPEGRRIWIHVRGFTSAGVTVFESGAYDFATGILSHDEQVKVYEIHPGLSDPIANALGLPAGPSFHFVLNDTVFSDNRIPPRGFTNAAFEAIQSPPVDYAYADGQYWDVTPYALPTAADSATVTVYYQATSKEYVEFLRDENHTNSAGQDLYDAWAANGKSTPVVMARQTVPVAVTVGVEDARPDRLIFALNTASPNPFLGSTGIAYTIEQPGPVRLAAFDVRGRLVRTLVDDVQVQSNYEIRWDGRDDAGRDLAGGIYFVRLLSGGKAASQRVLKLD